MFSYILVFPDFDTRFLLIFLHFIIVRLAFLLLTAEHSFNRLKTAWYTRYHPHISGYNIPFEFLYSFLQQFVEKDVLMEIQLTTSLHSWKIIYFSILFEPFPDSPLIFNIAWRNYLIITQKKNIQWFQWMQLSRPSRSIFNHATHLRDF